MLKPLLTRLLNHLVNQNAWARTQLQPFGGKVVRCSIPPLTVTLSILEDGGLAAAGRKLPADASLTIPLPAALRLLADDEAAASLATLEGDTELAGALAGVLRGMNWEYEEDLSNLIGDIPAHQLAQTGRKLVDGLKAQAINLVQMLSEYWQEEQPLLAKQRHIENFNRQVDELREDTDRLAKRIELLAQRGSTTAQN